MSEKPDKQEVINRDVNAAMRAVQALQLRAKKLTYEQIAMKCGYANPGACRKAILREMDRTVVKNVDELRMLEVSMLDLLHSECWDLAMDKSNKARLFAVDRILAISERRSKIMGMDVPISAVSVVANAVVVREMPAGYLGEKP